MKKNKTKKKLTFNKFFTILLLIISTIFSILLVCVNLLPNKLLIPILVFLLIYNVIVLLLLRLKNLKKKIKKIIYIFSSILIVGMGIASFFIFRTLNVLNSNDNDSYKIETFSVLVLKDSSYNKIGDLSGKEMGYYSKTDNVEDANAKIKKKVNVMLDEYSQTDSLIKDLEIKKIDSMVIENSLLDLINEEYEEFSGLTKVIYTFSIKVKDVISKKDVNVVKKPFAVYISGIDTYGPIGKVSRSDVNLIAAVHPETKQILLVSIPRDYYVQLHGTTGTRDKLTHAGTYGIDMSIQTLEDLLEIDINYYLKVNFTSVEDIVDAIGGVDVYSEYTFKSFSGYSFVEGYNKMNGKEALDFARTRKAFASGDRQRGINQEALLTAIINKATSKSIITKYNSLLSSIDGKYQTNMSTKQILALIRMQLNDMAKWNITSISLTGYDSYDYTYTYPQVLYVMEPDVGSVNLAIELLDKLLNGEVLEGPYTFDPIVPKINTRTSAQKPTTTIEEETKEEPETNEIEEPTEEPAQEAAEEQPTEPAEEQEQLTGEGLLPTE